MEDNPTEVVWSGEIGSYTFLFESLNLVLNLLSLLIS